MIQSQTTIDQHGPRLPEGQTEGTIGDLKTVPTHYKITLTNIDEEQVDKIARFINDLNMKELSNQKKQMFYQRFRTKAKDDA